MTPCVSVVMSVYNGAKFLAPAVESILAQSFKNFEFIIVNDGSIDESLAILRGYAKRDPRIRLITRENKGLIASLNEAVAMARGEWIARMDADDISLPNRLDKQLARLQETGADICGGQIQLLGTWPSRVWSYYVSNEAIRLKMLFGSPFAHPAVMLRTHVAKANPYSEDASYVEDYDLWARLAMKNIKMTNHSEVVLQYRIHAEQVTAIKQKQQRENMIRIFQQYSGFFLGDGYAETTGYLLIADKQRDINEEGFENAVAFLNALLRRFGDPEGVVSGNAFIFLTRCGGLGPFKIMPIGSKFKLSVLQKLILLVLSVTRASPRGKLYKFLYLLR
ncbi:glycosyltransferase [Pollutimonas sp. M17]|uniref:glycosyltransferase n=1 Tax=Pollutimonas sp. M17 TaxID=2962065 RepID=UPI0021F4C085|nr:glycosyltransferase [Pollutimonas sp. M17]UYO93990.1 glycosyltransferase [Pollutimonas sp. M17]